MESWLLCNDIISRARKIVSVDWLLGAVHILRNTVLGGTGLHDLLQYYKGVGGGGSPQFITILHRKGLPNLSQLFLGGFQC